MAEGRTRRRATASTSSAPKKTLLEQQREKAAEGGEDRTLRRITAVGATDDGEQFEVRVRPYHQADAADHPFSTSEPRLMFVATWLALGSPGGDDGFEDWLHNLDVIRFEGKEIPPTNGSRPSRS